MPKDDINYRFTENGIVYDFYDVFVPAENFRQPALWTWGQNNQGQLGDTTTTNRNTPVTTFAGGTTWKQVSCGYHYTLAIKTDGTLWGFGANNPFGQTLALNDNSFTIRSTPVTTFAGGNNWKRVSSGGGFAAAIKTDGTLWIWGNNEQNQLGINNWPNILTPVTTFAGGNTWKSVSCGFEHTAAIKTDGSLWVWGRNSYGSLGINNTTPISTPVTTFAGGNNWKEVFCGRHNTAAIKTDGSLWVWGRGTYGTLGTNDTANRSIPVTTFAGGNDWKNLTSGSSGQSCTAIKTDGSLWVWGRGGGLGINDFNDRSTAVTTFAGGNNWKQVSCGQSHSAAIKTDGSLWVWGGTSQGQGGINTDGGNSILTPVTTFAGGNNWKSVAAGSYHTLAIKYSPDP